MLRENSLEMSVIGWLDMVNRQYSIELLSVTHFLFYIKIKDLS